MSHVSHGSKTIGILALQGDYEAHRIVLEDRLATATLQVRRPRDLESVDALILPGGESTAIAKLLTRIGLAQPVRDRAKAGMPVYGTCAGMILLAAEVDGRPDQPTLDLMDICVARNAFGRQVDSFEADVNFGADGVRVAVRGVFIRAPYVARVGATVQVLATFEDRVVGVRQGSLMATAFHPELTNDTGVHAEFVRMVNESQERR